MWHTRDTVDLAHVLTTTHTRSSTRDTTHSYLWHDKLTFVTWHFPICETTHPYMWHTRPQWSPHTRTAAISRCFLYIFGIWKKYMALLWICMVHLCGPCRSAAQDTVQNCTRGRTHPHNVTLLIPICDMTHPYMRHIRPRRSAAQNTSAQPLSWHERLVSSLKW